MTKTGNKLAKNKICDLFWTLGSFGTRLANSSFKDCAEKLDFA
jgi:hypothetical protein